MALAVLFAGLALACLPGCQGPKATSFAPLDFRLEPIPGGGARHPVVVNVSGRELTNYKFSGRVWNYHNRNRLSYSMPIADFNASGQLWRPGDTVRFEKRFRPGSEAVVTDELTTVMIVGRCDQGSFRQTWESTPDGNLRLTIPRSHGNRP